MKPFLPILLLFIVSCGHAQSNEHPVDVRNVACHDIDSNQTTYGMMECESLASEEWKVEMNKYYNLLLDTLSGESSVLLKQSQEAWIEYNKKENLFSSSLYYSDMEGTMWRVVNAGRLKDIIRKRALDLKEYYETFTYLGM
jgi:uncharacterized protein YecT (DUF1311 family)